MSRTLIGVAELSGAGYFVRSACLLGVVTGLGWGAFRLRARVLPEWRGAPARLAEVVLVITVGVTVAELLGSIGAFKPLWMLLVLSIAAGVMAAIGRSGRGAVCSGDGVPDPRSPREEFVAAALAIALVAAQWASHVGSAVERGMIHTDTLAYHAPFTASFVQTGWLTRLPYDTEAVRAHFPLNAELVQALFVLPYGNDFLSPFVNLGWAALGVLAAWCGGRRYGMGALCVLGSAVLLGLPTLAGTQPGQGSSDVAAMALLLSGVVLVLEGGITPAPAALAGLATGLALGTKLNLVVPVGVLTIGVLFLAVRARRPVVALLWTGGVLMTSGYWFVHNWIESGNPFPWYDLELGPIHFTAVAHDNGLTLANHLFDRAVWDFFYLPGLWRGLGRAWPIVLAVGVGGALTAIVRGRSPFQRVAGAAVIAGVVAHVFTPNSGGFTFMFNLRYLAPALAIGFVLAAIAIAGASTIWRRVAAGVLAAVVVLDALAAHHEKTPAWPHGQWGVAVVAGATVLALAVVIAKLVRGEWKRHVAIIGSVVLVAVVATGWFVQRESIEQRYVRAGLPLDSTHEVFRKVHDANVGVFGTLEVYPMFGPDLSNRVSTVEGPQSGAERRRCRTWFRLLDDARYRYIVLTHRPLADPGPPEAWIDADPAATELLRDGETTVYRIRGALDPNSCS